MDEIRDNWEMIKETIRKEYDLTEISFRTWIKPLKFHAVIDDVVTILIPAEQSHALTYISNKYKSYFQVTISELFDHNYSISFLLEKDVENPDDNEQLNLFN